MKQLLSNFASRQRKIAIKVAQISNFQSLKFKVWTLHPYGGLKAPRKGPKGLPALHKSQKEDADIVVRYSLLEHSSSEVGVIQCLCKKVLPMYFHFDTLVSALIVDKIFYSSISYDSNEKIVTHIQTNMNIHNDIPNH